MEFTPRNNTHSGNEEHWLTSHPMINSKIITLYMPQENLLWVHRTHILLAQCPRLTLLSHFHRDLYFSWRSRTHHHGLYLLEVESQIPFPHPLGQYETLHFKGISVTIIVQPVQSDCWKRGEYDALVGDDLLWSGGAVRLFMKALKRRCKNLEAALELAQKSLEVNCLSKRAKTLWSLQEILMGC